tara:strand:+ start:1822 stop:2673 length:852 start_codon:yes stop_codon:yes gene_type:complete
MELKLNSYAKVNLFLRVFKKLKSGYHKIESIMQRIDLYDTIKYEKTSGEIEIHSNNKEIETEDNLAYKAAQLLKDTQKVKHGVNITIEKNIPLSSGLGGGSSNAGTTLLALNKLWKLRLDEKQLIDLGAQLGADVPFFLSENAAFVSGIGELIKPIKKPYKMNITLINPGFRISTTAAYKMLDKFKPPKNKKPASSTIVNAMANNSTEEVASTLYNDFEEPSFKKYPILKEIKTNLRRNRALNSTLTGSGPTMFGIFSSIYTAREAYYELKDMYPFVFLAKTI